MREGNDATNPKPGVVCRQERCREVVSALSNRALRIVSEVLRQLLASGPSGCDDPSRTRRPSSLGQEMGTFQTRSCRGGAECDPGEW